MHFWKMYLQRKLHVLSKRLVCPERTVLKNKGAVLSKLQVLLTGHLLNVLGIITHFTAAWHKDARHQFHKRRLSSARRSVEFIHRAFFNFKRSMVYHFYRARSEERRVGKECRSRW